MTHHSIYSNTSILTNKETTTEEKIKVAARVVFLQKGYAATRTRDIAEQADINLALVTYYFKSKKKLFDLIMIETLTVFFHQLTSVLNDPCTNLDAKIELIVNNYITFLSAHPGVALFLMSELRNNPKEMMDRLPIRNSLTSSYFLKQYLDAVADKEVNEPNPLHFFLNLMACIIFPFIIQPLLMGMGEMDEGKFNELMEERKSKIPLWIKIAMKA